MNYTIEVRSDLFEGQKLVAKIPEQDIDKKALHTINNDFPSFLVPFKQQVVNGEMVFTFSPGNSVGIHYLGGSKALEEYYRFWKSLLTPLFDCSDWFLNPLSFVLQYDHIFYDRGSDIVKYLYIPSQQNCCSSEELDALARRICETYRVSDQRLENQVLRALMEKFRPKEFLNMIDETVHKTNQKGKETPYNSPQLEQGKVKQPYAEQRLGIFNSPSPEPEINKPSSSEDHVAVQVHSNDNGLAGMNWDAMPGKKSKKENKKESKKKEKKAGKEEATPQKISKESGRLFKKKGNDKIANVEEYGAVNQAAMQDRQPAKAVPVAPFNDSDMDVTEIDESGPATLVRSGTGMYPEEISLPADAQTPFTIGRYDSSKGYRQSSFEFDGNLTSVSRRHAAIQLANDIYYITDIGSKNGTYVNDKQLPVGVAYALHDGDRISFGMSGPKYIFRS